MAKPKKLSIGQLKRISEILGNLSVAWFSGGVITPLLTKPKTFYSFLYSLIISLIMFGIFFILSLETIKKIKS